MESGRIVDPIDVVLALHTRGLLDNEGDQRFAKALEAALPARRDNDHVRHFAWRACSRHSTTLAEVGYAYRDILPTPTPPNFTVQAVREALGARPPEKVAATPDDRVYSDHDMVVNYDDLFSRFEFHIKFSERFREAIRMVPGREWDQRVKAWCVPKARWRQVVHLAEEFGLRLTGEASFEIAAMDAAGIDDVEEYQVFLDESARRLVLKAGWHEEAKDAIKAIPGSKHDKKADTWSVPENRADAFRDLVERYALLVHPSAESTLRLWSDKAEKMRQLSVADDAELEIPTMSGELRPFQRAGTLYAQHAENRTIIGDEMGLGKTVQALAAAELNDRWPVVIVCPPVVTVNWQREIAKFFPHRTSVICRGENAQYMLGAPPNFMIVGYSVVSNWEKVLINAHPQGIIADESHYCKAPTTQRTLAVKAIAGVPFGNRPPDPKAVPYDGLKILTSGTYVLNDVKEVIPQLAIIDRLSDFGGEKAFRARYVNLKKLTEAQAMERIEELHQRLRAICYVRRRKEDVLSELPPKQRSFVWVDGDPKYMKEYQDAEDDLIEYLAWKAREIALELGLDPHSAEMMARMKASAGALALKRINVLRQIVAKAKLKAAAEWAKMFLESGESLVVFAHHRGIVEHTSKTLGDADMLYGGQTPTSRQDAIDAFQAKTSKALIVGITAGGIGITLTAASNELFIEQAWNPGTLLQAEDRCHRIGQHDSVNVYYLLVPGTIDQDMMDLLEEKRAVVDRMTDGRDVDSWEACVDDEKDPTASSKSIFGEIFERYVLRAIDGPQHVRNEPADTEAPAELLQLAM